MGEWKTYRLGEICKNIIDYRGKTPAKLGADWAKSGYRVFSAKNIKTGNIVQTDSIRYVDENLYRKWMKDEIERGDIIITSEAPFGEVYYWDSDEKIVLGQRLFGLKINEICYPKYLYYYMTTAQFQSELKNRATGTTVIGLRQPELLKCTVNLPPLEEQRRIAGILGSLDDKIELNRRINANLEAQAQALFRSWFVDFEPFRDGPFVDSELGKIPQGWKVGNYTDIVEIKGGGTPKTGIQEYWNGTIPFFSPKDVGASCFVLDTEKHITAKGLENCNSSLFQPNTVFITARGTVGKVVMTGTEMAMNQTNYALLGKQNISQYYVYHITLQLVARLLKKANGAVFNAITTRDFTSEQIVIPPFSTISQFSDVVKPIYENILLNDVQSNRLSALRDTMLPKLMAGEIAIE
ncbi:MULTISPECIES: restriction endonuclease subunit S [Alistipes]|uniref:restriction endonuclease subunit S n=1 Tax=Alistipes TaxID=239759 RepID=UPI0026668AB0|nr:restriction endonuclease subunit S [Alistipes communis]